MNRFICLKFCLILFLFSFCAISAHVRLDNPVGGEVFNSGETVFIHWTVIVSHPQENWDLFLSTDGGITWTPIILDLPVFQMTYEWTMPELSTETARVKVIMDNTGLNYEDESENFTIASNATGVETKNSNANSFELFYNYPNPFNPTTTIKYSVPSDFNGNAGDGFVVLKIFDSLGGKIETLVNTTKSPGNYEVTFNGSQLSSGVYYYTINAGSYSAVRKMLLVK